MRVTHFAKAGGLREAKSFGQACINYISASARSAGLQVFRWRIRQDILRRQEGLLGLTDFAHINYTRELGKVQS